MIRLADGAIIEDFKKRLDGADTTGNVILVTDAAVDSPKFSACLPGKLAASPSPRWERAVPTRRLSVPAAGSRAGRLDFGERLVLDAVSGLDEAACCYRAIPEALR